jgi:hypothetical protein
VSILVSVVFFVSLSRLIANFPLFGFLQDLAVQGPDAAAGRAGEEHRDAVGDLLPVGRNDVTVSSIYNVCVLTFLR